MAHRCLRRFRLAKPPSLPHVRAFHPTLTSFVVADPSSSFPSTSSSSSPVTSSSSTPLPSQDAPPSRPDTLPARKLEELRAVLSLKSPDPNRVWLLYQQVLHLHPGDTVPLEIHQRVLRKCVPPPLNVRTISARHRVQRTRWEAPAVYESRYRQVLRNIRSTGQTPSLREYHCILQYFAARGDFNNALLLLKEINRQGLAKQPRTYSYVFMSIAHRLTFPMDEEKRRRVVLKLAQRCNILMEEMSRANMPLDQVNVDLVTRILKESMDMEAFTTLMRNAYGIDMDFPDRLPLRYWENRSSASTDDAADSQSKHVPARFNIHAFHTALEFLGSQREVSKLVQLFEVVTNPLPASAIHRNPNEEEDDDFGESDPQVAPFKPPQVQPTTKTYAIMIKWLANAGHLVLVRHYVTAAIDWWQDQTRTMKAWTLHLPANEIPALRMSLNHSHFTPAVAVAVQERKVLLTRWLHVRIARAARRHKYDIEYYTELRERWQKLGFYTPSLSPRSDMADETTEDHVQISRSRPLLTYVDPALPQPEHDEKRARLPKPPVGVPRLDIDTHLRVLRHEFRQLSDLEKETEKKLAGATTRKAQWVGRQVWAEKPIFVPGEPALVKVSPEEYTAQLRGSFKTTWQTIRKHLKRRRGSTRAMEWRRWQRRPPLFRGAMVQKELDAEALEIRPPLVKLALLARRRRWRQLFVTKRRIRIISEKLARERGLETIPELMEEGTKARRRS
ncbi:uncharacterized protein BXZ73DRAFT_40193 [Epithele typhae]|uniref:uncharacterized protein n=1 Tax=Epithele typhae TaxID=378194 RepID=UPI0020075FEB|nr:uncharacterized protein BXZ73DRAFT_40193 [Epithele typhae]KAH9943079.1 hypothetical protein BXZ73DRAFT_40193 [Epithele typhae]